MPRTRPPFPAEAGLGDKPTIINNVETLGTLPNIVRHGAQWYAQYGTETSKGTKTFSLVGRLRRTGLIEVPLGMPLRRVIEDIGGGSPKAFKGVQTGGPSGGCLGAEFLDSPIDYEALAAAGSIMGSGGLIVLDKNTCIVDTAKYFLDFTQAESCGKCVPCRVGTRHLVSILERITQGKGEIADLDRLEQLARVIRGGSLCGLGQTAPNPVLTALKYFRGEFLAHIVEKRCPAAVCRDLVVYRIITGKCTGCQRCVRGCPTGAITGPRAEPHNLDASKCIKCRSCYEVCRFDAVAGDAIVIESGV
jgi:NADH:ubiquinone oxidoreductase subunit F (NADH-binding)/NAD-dependent dihydropyrimidine dehydrogenase PreA subunit